MRSSIAQFATAAVMFVLLSRVPAAWAFVPRPQQSYHAVVIVDGSGTYKQRVAEAIQRVIALLSKMAETRLHRWETTPDRVTVIGLDAVPAVLWQGTVAKLKAMKPDFWTKRFQARTDYAACTDIGGAFRLTAGAFAQDDPRYVDRFLWAYTDLIDEPPTTSVRKCRPARHPSLPPQDFPWESLTDVSVSVFWAPPDQALAWKRAVAEHGLEKSFRVYTDSESAAVEIKAPEHRTVPMSKEEATGALIELWAAFVNGIKWVGKGFIAVVLGALGVVTLFSGLIMGTRWLVRLRRTHRPPRTPQPRPMPSRQGQPGRALHIAPRPPASGAGRAS